MAWTYLLLAAGFEVIFATAMKASEGFTRLWPTIAVVIGVTGGIGFLTLALKTMPVSVGYPVWVGLGTLGAVIVGATLFGEAIGPMKLFGIALIGGGVALLKVSAA